MNALISALSRQPHRRSNGRFCDRHCAARAGTLIRGRPAWLSALLIAAALAMPGVVAAQPAVGEVAMAIGDVVRIAGDQRAPLRAGDTVREGDTILAGADGHVHIRSVDAGFISVRPDSRLRFDVYRFDPANPSASRFRLVLDRGVMRSISGDGVKAARERYRLNTPLAAIGLRGTDFAVYADAEVTRVTVRQGGVVMAPLGGACAVAGFGPCEGSSARDLLADRAGTALMQLRRGEPVPTFQDLGRHPGAPDKVAPPLPGEGASAGAGTAPAASRPADSGKLALENGPSLVSRIGDQDARLGVRLESAVVSPVAAVNPPVAEAPVLPVVPVMPVVPVAPVPLPLAVEWGRWREIAGAPAGTSLDALTASGRKLEVLDSYYALVRDNAASTALPTAGVYSFRLDSHDGYLYNTATRAATPSAVGESSLTVDFDRGRFATRLGLSAGDTARVLDAKGTVYPTGELVYNLIQSNAVVNGVLGGQAGADAGYLYHLNVDANRQFVGATLWRR